MVLGVDDLQTVGHKHDTPRFPLFKHHCEKVETMTRRRCTKDDTTQCIEIIQRRCMSDHCACCESGTATPQALRHVCQRVEATRVPLYYGHRCTRQSTGAPTLRCSSTLPFSCGTSKKVVFRRKVESRNLCSLDEWFYRRILDEALFRHERGPRDRAVPT